MPNRTNYPSVVEFLDRAESHALRSVAATYDRNHSGDRLTLALNIRAIVSRAAHDAAAAV